MGKLLPEKNAEMDIYGRKGGQGSQRTMLVRSTLKRKLIMRMS
jgi:hypothetical protein